MATDGYGTYGNGGSWGGTWGNAPIYGRRAPAGVGDFSAARYFGTPSQFDQLFWQSREGMPFAYDRFVRQEADPLSNYGRWLASQEGEVASKFVDASRADPALAYTDSIAQQAQGLAQRYTQLPGWQRGMGTGVTSAGRRLG